MTNQIRGAHAEAPWRCGLGLNAAGPATWNEMERRETFCQRQEPQPLCFLGLRWRFRFPCSASDGRRRRRRRTSPAQPGATVSRFPELAGGSPLRPKRLDPRHPGTRRRERPMQSHARTCKLFLSLRARHFNRRGSTPGTRRSLPRRGTCPAEAADCNRPQHAALERANDPRRPPQGMQPDATRCNIQQTNSSAVRRQRASRDAAAFARQSAVP
jgi:hypothetical protein